MRAVLRLLQGQFQHSIGAWHTRLTQSRTNVQLSSALHDTLIVLYEQRDRHRSVSKSHLIPRPMHIVLRSPLAHLYIDTDDSLTNETLFRLHFGRQVLV